MKKVDYMKPSGWKKVSIKNKSVVTLKNGAVIPSWSAMVRQAKKIK